MFQFKSFVTPCLHQVASTKKILTLSLLSSLLLSTCLSAATIMEVKKRENRVSATLGAVANASVKGGTRDGEEMHLSHWSVLHSRSDERFLLPYGVNHFTAGIKGFSPKWDDYADLNGKSYTSALLGVGLRLPNVALFENNLFFDLTADIDSKTRSFKDLLFLGKLYLSIPKDQIHWTLGIFTSQGRLDRVYAPIIGLRYKIDDSWSLNLMAPKVLQLAFHEKESRWHLTGQVETLGTRYRFRKDATTPGAWSYKSFQAGLNAKYILSRRSELSMTAGTNLLGKIKIFDAAGTETAEHDFDTSAFGQLQLLLHW